MRFRAPEAKREPLPSTANCGAAAGVASCGAWSLRTAVEFDEPPSFLMT